MWLPCIAVICSAANTLQVSVSYNSHLCLFLLFVFVISYLFFFYYLLLLVYVLFLLFFVVVIIVLSVFFILYCFYYDSYKALCVPTLKFSYLSSDYI